MKVGLGAAQFGSAYGISNPQGKPCPDEISKILRFADSSGIRLVDTASLYGDSEATIGRALATFADQFRIVTKTPRFSGLGQSRDACDYLERAFLESLARLRKPSIYGLLFHDAEDLLRPGGDRLLERMLSLKTSGLVSKIGVSIYSPAQADRLLGFPGMDLIQLPVNILDQRAIESKTLARLKKRGFEIHARSAFLQGLLLMDPDNAPRYFSPIRNRLESLRNMMANQGISPLQACLSFVGQRPEIDHILVGVNSARELQEIVAAVGSPARLPDLSRFSVADERFVEPRHWKLE